MAETAYINKYKVYEEACVGCWYHGDEDGSCNLSEPCEKLVWAFASAPAADVVEVVHGEWVLLDDCSNSGLYCSVCRRRVHREDFAYKKLRSKYCPHCGAKMDGGENDVSG